MKSNLEPGHCWLSGTPCFEVLEVYENSHPLAGHVRKIGGPVREAFKIDLLLMDGTTTHVTIHEDCLFDLKKCLNKIWHAIIERTIWEWKKRKELGLNYTSEAQEKAVVESITRKTIDNPPVGILCITRWIDGMRKELYPGE